MSDASNKEHRNEYVINIKKALNKAREKAGVSYAKMEKDIDKLYGFKLDDKTLRQLFNYKNSEGNKDYNLNFACLVTVCRYFGFDLNKLLSPPLISEEEELYRAFAEPRYRAVEDHNYTSAENAKREASPFIKDMLGAEGKFQPLKEDSYVGTFYGYRASEENSESKIFRFNLKLEKDENASCIRAKMTTYLLQNDPSGKKKLVRTFHGIPMLSESCRIILLFLVDDESGEFYQLTFPYERYGKGMKLIYRHGVMIIGKQDKPSEVCTQNFWIFNRKLSEEEYKDLRGLLRARNHTFTISVKDAEDIAERDEIVAEFLRKNAKLLENEYKEVYVINEKKFLTGVKDKIKQAKALLRLKEKSNLQTAFHYRIKDDKYRKLAIKMAGVEFDTGEDEDD